MSILSIDISLSSRTKAVSIYMQTYSVITLNVNTLLGFWKMVTLACTYSPFSWDSCNNSFFNIKSCTTVFAQSFEKKKKRWKHNE